MNPHKTSFSTLALVSILSAFLLTGCSASGGSNDAAVSFEDSSVKSLSTAEDSGEAGIELAADPDSGGSQQSVITTGSATIRTSHPDAVSARFIEDVTALGGRIDSTWQSEWSGSLSATVTARVPADAYQGLVDSLSNYGKVLDQNTSRQDVGLQITDLTARREALETSIVRLKELVQQASTTEDLLQAEDMLTQRQSELDSLNSQLEWLTQQVDMSTLDVTFTEESHSGQGFSWERAWDLLLQSVRFVAYAAIVAGPWVILAGLLIWAGRAIVRRRRGPHSQSEPEQTEPSSNVEFKDKTS